MTDTELEAQIDKAFSRGMAAQTRDEQRAAFADMTTLVKQRSSERIEQMERERRLR